MESSNIDIHSCPMSNTEELLSLYPYDPSKVAPILFAAIVSPLGFSLFYQSYIYKWHHFNILMAWASLVWVTGFILRALSAWSPANVDLYLSSVRGTADLSRITTHSSASIFSSSLVLLSLRSLRLSFSVVCCLICHIIRHCILGES